MANGPTIARRVEVVTACVVIMYGIRTATPLTPSAMHTPWWWRILFGLIVLVPGVMLLRANRLNVRKKALLGVAAGNIYVTAAILGTDLTRWASASATLGLSVIAFILYAGARSEGRTRE